MFRAPFEHASRDSHHFWRGESLAKMLSNGAKIIKIGSAILVLQLAQDFVSSDWH